MTVSGFTRKSLGRRLAEHLDSVGADWSTDVVADRLIYRVRRNGMVMEFTPGELADVVGVPVVES